MKLTEEFYQIPVAPERHLKMTYAQLNACGMDFDFTSVLQDGKDFHKITQDICVSYQKFHEGHLTNLFFSRKTPVLLDLGDADSSAIIPITLSCATSFPDTWKWKSKGRQPVSRITRSASSVP